MSTYNINYTANKQYVEIAPNTRGWQYAVAFNITELGYSDTLYIPAKEFTEAKVKELIKVKLNVQFGDSKPVVETATKSYTEEIETVVSTK